MLRLSTFTTVARVAAAALLLTACGTAFGADPQAVGPTAGEPSVSSLWRSGGSEAANDALRARARSYAADRVSVPEPGALATAAVALAATGLGIVVGRRRARRPLGGAEWDGGDESVLAS